MKTIGKLSENYRKLKKTHIFRSPVHANKLCCFEKVVTIRVAMGSVKFRIAPEASVFRDDAYFDGPGAQKYHV